LVSRNALAAGFEAAITKGAMKLQGRPTLARALHKSGRKTRQDPRIFLRKRFNRAIPDSMTAKQLRPRNNWKPSANGFGSGTDVTCPGHLK
jgi:hypothetical protein